MTAVSYTGTAWACTESSVLGDVTSRSDVHPPEIFSGRISADSFQTSLSFAKNAPMHNSFHLDC
jgi:hypothetical protein